MHLHTHSGQVSLDKEFHSPPQVSQLKQERQWLERQLEPLPEGAQAVLPHRVLLHGGAEPLPAGPPIRHISI